MKRVAYIILLYLSMMSGVTYAGVPRAVSGCGENLALCNVLTDLANHLNTLECLTSDPNGSVLGRTGDLKCATISGCNNICMNTSSGPNAGTSWSCFCPSATCPGGSDTHVQYNDASSCGGDEGFTFNESTNLVNINEATDGDSMLLSLENDQTLVAFDTNQTTSMEFGFSGAQNAAILRLSQLADFTTDARKQASFEILQMQASATPTTTLRIDGFNTAGIHGGASQPRNGWDINGNLAVGNGYAFTAGVTAPTNGAIIQGQVGIGINNPSTFTTYPLTIGGSGIMLLYGTSNDIFFGQTSPSDTDVFSISYLQTAGGYPANGPSLELNADTTSADEGKYIFINSEDETGVASETPAFVVGSDQGTAAPNVSGQEITVASGTTITNQRQIIFHAPIINGVAGGATETITNPATLYIDAAPSGSNITFTNGPYAIWVDDGAVRFDGSLIVGSIDTGGGTALELASGVWTPTTNNIQNFGSSSAAEGQYLRVGSTVTGSIQLTVDPTLSATTTELELDLPVASNFGATSDAAGSCGGSDVASEVAEIRADATSDELEVIWITNSLASHELSCSFSYQII